jgi:hypothetical protein
VRFAQIFFQAHSFLGDAILLFIPNSLKCKHFHGRQRLKILALKFEVIDLITAIDPRLRITSYMEAWRAQTGNGWVGHIFSTINSGYFVFHHHYNKNSLMEI